ncbi:hypothetical protein KQX54_004989 [Cotesia glomerata]|uniref:Uncharacterized protein n=1 Tax=Cotesia glomerata TaxID=32391 RepID=A0AAV7ICP6_COTGL|nr:hypothetical protein KQX54_004989 [Cotesia glomerata]
MDKRHSTAVTNVHLDLVVQTFNQSQSELAYCVSLATRRDLLRDSVVLPQRRNMRSYRLLLSRIKPPVSFFCQHPLFPQQWITFYAVTPPTADWTMPTAPSLKSHAYVTREL